MGLVIGIITSFLTSIGDSFRKIAIDESKMSNSLFNLFAYFLGTLIIVGLFLYFGFNSNLLLDGWLFIFLFFILLTGFINQFILLYVYKKEKLSVLLPYDSLDKVFVVLLGFLIFAGTPQQGSLITLLITFITIGVIFYFSTDLKKISFPKTVLLFFLFKFIRACTILGTGYVLLSYTSIDFVIIEAVLLLGFSSVLVFWKKESPKEIVSQSKRFYINRLLATIIGWSGYILGLYIIQSSGVIIATLLGFFTIVFSVFSMKFILKDTPSKKQIVLAFFVMMMIGIGYYFK